MILGFTIQEFGVLTLICAFIVLEIAPVIGGGIMNVWSTWHEHRMERLRLAQRYDMEQRIAYTKSLSQGVDDQPDTCEDSNCEVCHPQKSLEGYATTEAEDRFGDDVTKITITTPSSAKEVDIPLSTLNKELKRKIRAKIERRVDEPGEVSLVPED